MIQATITSNKTGRVIMKSYSAKQLLDDYCGESDLMVAMTECDCEPTGMLSFVECNCYEEWEEWTLVLKEQSENVQID
ncbi:MULTISPECIES: acetyltransferase [unclassified Psychrobacillus]|uniref:acetyltransferase n=1 Tax=unclassified Psychrobacillus TaxID=2636677 RepID=UPI0030FB4DF7